jgi:16S rRNA (adenine1518-N6/adenine1519-N6)-dimethyltransferase
VHADALTVDFSTFGRASLIANIPYNITTPLIAHLAQYKQHFDSITIMIQKEVAQRLLADPGTKQYGAFGIFCQYHFAIEKGFVVSRQCFSPIPGVDSMVIRLLPRKSALSPTDEARFFSMTRSFFWGRRKTMLNCLLQSPHANVDRAIQDDIDLTNILAARGEVLGLNDHLALFQRVNPYLL